MSFSRWTELEHDVLQYRVVHVGLLKGLVVRILIAFWTVTYKKNGHNMTPGCTLGIPSFRRVRPTPTSRFIPPLRPCRRLERPPLDERHGAR